MTYRSIIGALLLAGTLSACAWPLDYVSFQRDGQPRNVSGEIVIEAADGGVLLQDQAGRLWAITAEELQGRKEDNVAFRPYDGRALEEVLARELPPGFRFHHTAHFVIAYDTSLLYARWCGSLFERLYAGFTNYWKQRGCDLHEPPAPLIAQVFAQRSAYARYASAELGEATRSVVGYYSLRTNRMTMFDLTGADTRRVSSRVTTADHITRILSQPGAERTVATIVHEATHQLSFNCGLLVRYADVPLWVSEGIAVYFETPDLRSRRGWRTIGGVNRVRLIDFRRYLPRRPADSLVRLIRDDERFRQTDTAADAYAETWALHYFLLQRHQDEYIKYLKALGTKRPLVYDEPEERIAEFQKYFAVPLETLDRNFVRTMMEVR